MIFVLRNFYSLEKAFETVLQRCDDGEYFITTQQVHEKFCVSGAKILFCLSIGVSGSHQRHFCNFAVTSQEIKSFKLKRTSVSNSICYS